LPYDAIHKRCVIFNNCANDAQTKQLMSPTICHLSHCVVSFVLTIGSN